MKYAKAEGVVGWSGGTTVLRAGAPAEDDHPLVKERPDLFADEPTRAELRVHNRPKVETTANRSSGRRANPS